MTFTNVLGTAIGTVRRLTHDTDAASAFWSDEEITDALSAAYVNSPKRAAAAELMAMAASFAVTRGKVAISGALSVDGTAQSNALLALAKQLLAEADAEDGGVVLEGADGLLDWAEMVPDQFSYRERLNAEYLREAG